MISRFFKKKSIERKFDRKDIQGLINIVENDSNPDIKLKAAISIGEIGNLESMQALVTALEDKNDVVRESASKGLCHIGQIYLRKLLDESTEDILIQHLSDKNPIVRANIVEALAASNGRAQEPIISITLNDESICVRRKSIITIGEIGNAKTVEQILQKNEDETEDAVIEALDRMAYRGATSHFNILREKRHIMFLNKILNKYPHSHGDSVVRILAKAGGDAAEEIIISILKNKNSPQRVRAAETLGISDSPAAKEALINTLYDDDRRVRKSVAEALGVYKKEKNTDFYYSDYEGMQKVTRFSSTYIALPEAPCAFCTKQPSKSRTLETRGGGVFETWERKISVLVCSECNEIYDNHKTKFNVIACVITAILTIGICILNRDSFFFVGGLFYSALLILGIYLLIFLFFRIIVYHFYFSHRFIKPADKWISKYTIDA